MRAALYDCSGGLFFESDARYCSRVIPFRDSEHNIHDREPLSDAQCCELPLFTRAWTFQEILLSNRVAHFTPNEIVWEFRETNNCECGHVAFTGPDDWLQRPPHPFQKWKRDIVNPAVRASWGPEWHRLVEMYTRRSLSYEKDIFPALQGLARVTSRYRKTTYLAGLWEDTLVQDLLWFVRPENIGYRPSTWRAPTWSWASTQGGIDYPFFNPTKARAIGRAVATVRYAAADSYGAVESGILEVTAPCLEVSLGFLAQVDHRLGGDNSHTGSSSVQGGLDAHKNHRLQHYLHRDFEGTFGAFAPGSLTYLPDYNYSDSHDGKDFIGESTSVQICLMFSKKAHLHMHTLYHCLVFRCMDEEKQVYGRIGYFSFYLDEAPKKFMNPFDLGKDRTLIVA